MQGALEASERRGLSGLGLDNCLCFFWRDDRTGKATKVAIGSSKMPVNDWS